jgi:hypothetical protein
MAAASRSPLSENEQRSAAGSNPFGKWKVAVTSAKAVEDPAARALIEAAEERANVRHQMTLAAMQSLETTRTQLSTVQEQLDSRERQLSAVREQLASCEREVEEQKAALAEQSRERQRLLREAQAEVSRVRSSAQLDQQRLADELASAFELARTAVDEAVATAEAKAETRLREALEAARAEAEVRLDKERRWYEESLNTALSEERERARAKGAAERVAAVAQVREECEQAEASAAAERAVAAAAQVEAAKLEAQLAAQLAAAQLEEAVASAVDAAVAEATAAVVKEMEAQHRQQHDTLAAEHSRKIDALSAEMSAEFGRKISEVRAEMSAEHGRRINAISAEMSAEHSRQLDALRAEMNAEHGLKIETLKAEMNAEHKSHTDALSAAHRSAHEDAKAEAAAAAAAADTAWQAKFDAAQAEAAAAAAAADGAWQAKFDALTEGVGAERALLVGAYRDGEAIRQTISSALQVELACAEASAAEAAERHAERMEAARVERREAEAEAETRLQQAHAYALAQAQAQAQEQAALQAALQAADAREVEMHARYQRLGGRYAAAEAELEACNAALATCRVELKASEAERGSLQDHRESMQQRADMMQQQHASVLQVLDTTRSELRAAVEAYDSLQARHRSLEEHRRTLDDQHASLANEHAAVAQEHKRLVEELAAAGQARMAVTERCTSLEAALVAAATRHDTLQTRHAALEDALETALLNRQVELETARMRTEAQEGRYAALHLSQAALEDALETALLNRQVELETARMSQAAVQAREAVLREAQEVLQASHETLQANLGQLQTSHGQLQVSHRSLMERLEASGARLEESERRCTAYEEQRGALRTRLDESQAAAQAAQAQVEETAMALEALDRERGLDARWQARLYSRAMRSAVRRWRAMAAMPEAAARALLARRERVEVDAAWQRLQELSRHARCLRSALLATRACCHRRLRHALTQWRHCIRQQVALTTALHQATKVLEQRRTPFGVADQLATAIAAAAVGALAPRRRAFERLRAAREAHVTILGARRCACDWWHWRLWQRLRLAAIERNASLGRRDTVVALATALRLRHLTGGVRRWREGCTAALRFAALVRMPVRHQLRLVLHALSRMACTRRGARQLASHVVGRLQRLRTAHALRRASAHAATNRHTIDVAAHAKHVWTHRALCYTWRSLIAYTSRPREANLRRVASACLQRPPTVVHAWAEWQGHALTRRGRREAMARALSSARRHAFGRLRSACRQRARALEAASALRRLSLSTNRLASPWASLVAHAAAGRRAKSMDERRRERQLLRVWRLLGSWAAIRGRCTVLGRAAEVLNVLRAWRAWLRHVELRGRCSMIVGEALGVRARAQLGAQLSHAMRAWRQVVGQRGRCTALGLHLRDSRHRRRRRYAFATWDDLTLDALHHKLKVAQAVLTMAPSLRAKQRAMGAIRLAAGDARAMRRCVGHLVHRRCAAAWAGWATMAEARTEAVQAMTIALGWLRHHVLIRAWVHWWELSTDGASASAVLSQAVAHLRRGDLMRGWRSWRRLHTAHRESLSRLDLARQRLSSLRVGTVLWEWRRQSARSTWRSIAAQLSMTTTAPLLPRTLRHRWRLWQQLAQQWRLAQVWCCSTLHDRMGVGWATWVAHAAARAAAMRMIEKGSRRLVDQGGVAPAWEAWRQAAAEKVDARQFMQSCLLRLDACTRAASFTVWATTSRRMADARRTLWKCIGRLAHLQAGRVWSVWAAIGASSRAARAASGRAHKHRLDSLRHRGWTPAFWHWHNLARAYVQQRRLTSAAFDRFLCLELSNAFHAWHRCTAQAAGDARAMRRCVGHLVHRRCAAAWAGWAAVAKARTEAVQAMTIALGWLRHHVLIRAWVHWWELSTDGASASAVLSQAVAHLRRGDLMRGWRSWRRLHTAHRESLSRLDLARQRLSSLRVGTVLWEWRRLHTAHREAMSLLRWVQGALEAHAVAVVLLDWRIATERRRERTGPNSHARERAIFAHLLHHVLAPAWHAWRTQLQEQARARVAAVRALSQQAGFAQGKAWASWTDTARRSSAIRAAHGHVVTKLRHCHYRLAWECWEAHASESRQARQRLRHSIGRLCHRHMSLVWAAWEATATARAAAKVDCLRCEHLMRQWVWLQSRMQRRGAWLHWVSLADERRAARERTSRANGCLQQRAVAAGFVTWRAAVTTLSTPPKRPRRTLPPPKPTTAWPVADVIEPTATAAPTACTASTASNSAVLIASTATTAAVSAAVAPPRWACAVASGAPPASAASAPPSVCLSRVHASVMDPWDARASSRAPDGSTPFADRVLHAMASPVHRPPRSPSPILAIAGPGPPRAAMADPLYTPGSTLAEAPVQRVWHLVPNARADDDVGAYTALSPRVKAQLRELERGDVERRLGFAGASRIPTIAAHEPNRARVERLAAIGAAGGGSWCEWSAPDEVGVAD